MQFLNILNDIGKNTPVILFFYSFFLLWSKENFLIYYCFGYLLCILSNLFLKSIIQQPRPNIHDQSILEQAIKQIDLPIVKQLFLYNVYGMPSGHAQISLYSALYVWLVLKKPVYMWIYFILICITLCQRVIKQRHTVLQVIVGAIIGALFGWGFFYIAREKLVGPLTIKKDDFFFL
jgi:membrane-associated phospholipid phosphatase